MEIIFTVLAFLATCYSLYLQRVHNAKSLKPLGQIELGDGKNRIYVHIQNNGMGPLIVDNLTFTREGSQFNTISNCLDLDSKSYWHTTIDKDLKKVIQPNSYLVVFEKNIEKQSNEEIDRIKKELTHILLKLNYRDIYDNKFSFERNLEWFSRYLNDKRK